MKYQPVEAMYRSLIDHHSQQLWYPLNLTSVRRPSSWKVKENYSVSLLIIKKVMKTIVSFLFVPFFALIATYIVFIAKNDHARFMHRPFGAQDIAQMSEGKVVVVTGANSGLGFSSVQLLAEGGTAKAVIMGCRNMEKCENAKNKIVSAVGDNATKLIPAQLDLASLSSIKNFAANLQFTLRELDANANDDEGTVEQSKNSSNPPKIDILLNNAGGMGLLHEVIEETGTEVHMHVNHLGHFALTSLLRDNLAKGGRVVSVASLMGALPTLDLNDINFDNSLRAQIRLKSEVAHYLMAYSASKRANLIFTHAVNQKFSSMGITALAAHPGYTRSPIMYNGWAHIPLWLKDILHDNKYGSMSCDEGALPQLRAALDDSVKPDTYVAPLWFVVGRPVIVGNSITSFHHLLWPIRGDDIVEKFWKFSEDAIGWKF
jgi:NAD(P)-dependent dehydrogenase (short-subunit alcohol dehydrogenase family)